MQMARTGASVILRRYGDTGENYIMRSLLICAVQQILLGG